MKRIPPGWALLVFAAFVAGLLSNFFYRRWTSSPAESRGYQVSFSPLPQPAREPAEIPLVQVRDTEKIRSLAGRQARIRGRVFRVGYSGKSNTHFLNFGPSRDAFTAVIFASALEGFSQKGFDPKGYQGRDVELTGEIKDHPKYGLEMVLERPDQVRVID